VSNKKAKQARRGQRDLEEANRRLIIIGLLPLVVSAVLIVIFLTQFPLLKSAKTYPPIYSLILNRLPAEPISKRYQPGFLFRNGEYRGVCTAVNTDFGWRIVTAGHMLRRDMPSEDEYTYELAYDQPPVQYSISEMSYPTFKQTGAIDLAIGMPGPAKPIRSITIEPSGKEVSDFVLTKSEDWVTCLTSGTRHRIIGKHTKSPRCFIDYQALDGESGTGFIVEGDDETLLVLIRGVWFLPETQAKIKQMNVSANQTFSEAVMTKSPPLSR